jgi:hypothetical protein
MTACWQECKASPEAGWSCSFVAVRAAILRPRFGRCLKRLKAMRKL